MTATKKKIISNSDNGTNEHLQYRLVSLLILNNPNIILKTKI